MAVRLLLVFALLHVAHSKVWDLTCSQIREFVDGHNFRRFKLAKGELSGQPPAAEMKFMVWDEGLAAKARAWASHNEFNHNPDQTDFNGRFDTGENIYITSSNSLSYKLSIDRALESWFNEHMDYRYQPLSDSNYPRQKPTGHYTQMVWSDTTYVGCAVSEYIEDNRKKYLVVCNYGPAGNYIGQTPYKVGRGNGKLLCVTKNCNNPYGSRC